MFGCIDGERRKGGAEFGSLGEVLCGQGAELVPVSRVRWIDMYPAYIFKVLRHRPDLVVRDIIVPELDRRRALHVRRFLRY